MWAKTGKQKKNRNKSFVLKIKIKRQGMSHELISIEFLRGNNFMYQHSITMLMSVLLFLFLLSLGLALAIVRGVAPLSTIELARKEKKVRLTL